MCYGEYTNDVQEVVDFVLSGNMLKHQYRRGARIGRPVLVVHSLENLERYRDGGHPQAEINADSTWTDIKMGDVEAMESLAFPEGAVAWCSTVVPELQIATNQIFGFLSESEFLAEIPGLSACELEEMTSHFSAAMAVRSMRGRCNDSLSESMFRAYQAFGYPCGWSGRHPSGSLVVYSHVNAKCRGPR